MPRNFWTPSKAADQYDSRVYDSIIDLAPNPDNPTPMVRLSDRMNPFGSIKDRTALYMLRGLRFEAGQTLVEPSAGNTGIVLAASSKARWNVRPMAAGTSVRINTRVN